VEPRFDAPVVERMTLASMTRPLLAAAAALGLAACSLMPGGPVGNPAVPQPSKGVDLNRYSGLWYEIGRYENGFERNCEAVTAEYRPRADGMVEVINTCHRGAVDGPAKRIAGRAKIVPGSANAKLKVSFFGPFFVGDYWVLDHAPDYGWSIVGEPSGRYLWLLSRVPAPSADVRGVIEARARALGYALAMLRPTRQ
jgi:apolipoprotein D and lipocalin family protein